MYGLCAPLLESLMRGIRGDYSCGWDQVDEIRRMIRRREEEREDEGVGQCLSTNYYRLVAPGK